MCNPIIEIDMCLKSRNMSRCDYFCPEKMPVFRMNTTTSTHMIRKALGLGKVSQILADYSAGISV